MNEKMQKTLLSFNEFLRKIPVPVFLFGICFITYGVLSPWLGFYLDDWYIVLYQKYFGANDFSNFFAQDRPFFGYIYQIFVPIFKDSQLAWQLFAVFSHALSVICFWWLLRKLIPDKNRLTLMAALFFAVYPGFQMHWFAVMYSQVFMLLAVYFLSFILMIESLQNVKWRIPLLIGGLFCLIVGVVPQETFFGIEFIRPILLWVVLCRENQNRRNCFRKTLLNWLPYLAVTIAFVIYRLGNTQSYSYQPGLFGELVTDPFATINNLVGEVFWAGIDALFRTWLNLINLLKRDLLSSVSIVMLVFVIIGGIAAWLILGSRNNLDPSRKPNGKILLISLLVTVTAMAPFLLGSFKITLQFPNNRYLIALAPGASLFLATLLDTLLYSDVQKKIAATIFIGFAVGAQLLNARSFMLNWQAQQDFFWQLSWRVPDLKPNTILLTDDLPFSDYYSGPSLTSPLNLIYGDTSDGQLIPFLFLMTAQQGTVIEDFSPDRPVNSSFRSFEFRGNTSQMILLKKYSEGCLHIITPQDSVGEFLYSTRYNFWKSAIPLSNLDQIILDSASPVVPDQKFFGKEDQNQWCYFYEKADLARQKKDWQETIRNYHEAEMKGFKPLVDSEWLPLLEAFLNNKEYDNAMELTYKVTNHDPVNVAGFCQLWDSSVDDENMLPFKEEIMNWLNCRALYD